MGMAQEWLPDVRKLWRGGIGGGRAATSRSRGLCSAVRKSQLREGSAIAKSNPPTPSQNLDLRAGVTWEGLGRRGRGGSAPPSQALLSCLKGKFT